MSQIANPRMTEYTIPQNNLGNGLQVLHSNTGKIPVRGSTVRIKDSDKLNLVKLAYGLW